MTKLANDRYPTIVLTLDDKDKFISYIKDHDFDKEQTTDDVEYYVSDGRHRKTFIAVTSGYAYVIPDVYVDDDTDAYIKGLKKSISAAGEKSYASTPVGDYMASSNAAAFALKFPKEIREELKDEDLPKEFIHLFKGYVCATADLDGDMATMKFTLFDEDGNRRKSDDFVQGLDMNARIDNNALAYLGKDENIVFAYSFKDANWSKLLNPLTEAFDDNDRTEFEIVKGYLKRINGTVAVGFGITNGLESLVSFNYDEEDVWSNISFTAVAQTAEGKAKNTINDIKGLLDEEGAPYETFDNGKGILISDDNIKLYIKADGDFVVLSNHKIAANNANLAAKEINFSDYLGAMAVAIPKTSALLKDLDINHDIIMTYYVNGTDLEGVAKFEIKDGKGKLLATALNIASTIYDNRRSIEHKINDIEDKYARRYYEDEPVDTIDWRETATVDEVAVPEDEYYEEYAK